MKHAWESLPSLLFSSSRSKHATLATVLSDLSHHTWEKDTVKGQPHSEQNFVLCFLR